MDTAPRLSCSLSALLLLAILSCSAGDDADADPDPDPDPDAPPCSDYQQAFDGSCYEFVSMQRTFLAAQGWCERGGGHLAFVLNDETQQFLQRHLDPGWDWWLGLAPTSQNLTLDATADGPLAWLDGSDVSYSNWVKDPPEAAGCSHILRDSGFQWEATHNCSQELYFVCEFESGRTLACVDQNATLQCGSGQVIEIDDSFYGRKTLHYCRASPGPTASPSQEECSWVDVVDLVAGHCHGLQVCQAAADVSSFGEPCPGLGSYLSVEYHCKDGLHLLMTKLAAVFDNVTITVKWLLHPYQGNLTCTLSAGDGHTIDPYSPEKAESSMVHRYTRPGVFVVGVECTTSEWHVTAQKTVTIQEPVGDFGVIKCYSLNQSDDSTNCKTLYGSPLKIQVELEAGTNITYRVQSGETTLVTSAALRGINPHNLTVGPDTQLQLGPGCHQLTLLASNGVTAADISMTLLACFLEPVGGLQASLVSEEASCPGSNLSISVSISLAHGAPVKLHFLVSGTNASLSATKEMSLSETREMTNGSLQEFSIMTGVQGTFQVRVRATNNLSEMELDVGNVTMLCNNSETNQDENSSEEHSRFPRDSPVRITADPDNPVIGTQSVTLKVKNLKGSADKYNFQWECTGSCQPSCGANTDSDELEITGNCLPDTFAFAKYSVTATKKNGQPNSDTASKCITVTPQNDLSLSISCSACNPVNVNQDLRLYLTCQGCETIQWYIESNDEETEDCSESTKQGKSGSAKYLINLNFPTDAPATPAPPTTTQTKQPPPSVTTKANTPAGPARPTGPGRPTAPPAPNLAPSTTPSRALPTTTTTASAPTTPGPPTCSVTPLEGTILTPFAIRCTTPHRFCSGGPCTYCFKTSKGNYLHCGNQQNVKSLFLPLGDKNSNYKLTISVSVKNTEGLTISTALTPRVTDASSDPKLKDLQALVSEQVAHLKQEGDLSGVALSQMYQSVSALLNEGTGGNSQKGARMELREEMLGNMSAALHGAPPMNPLEVQVTGEALVGLTNQADELTPSAQVHASTLLANLSHALISVNVTGSEGAAQVAQAAEPVVMTASNILTSSATSSNKHEISGLLLNTIGNVQTALLAGKNPNEPPAVFSTPKITVYVNRMSSDHIQEQEFTVQNSSSASFTFPAEARNVLPADEPVDVRMMSFGVNPFSWSGDDPISGTVGALSLTREDGSVIPVGNLTNDIEILLPRPEATQVNSTVLDLGNFSTVAINVTAPNVSLVLRLDPSEDIALQLLLGFQAYPNDTYHEALTQLPQEGAPQGEQYTWVLGPDEMAAGVGVYYLVVRPIVEAGVNSTNATVSVTSIAAQCMYWDETETGWNDHGCRVGPLTTPFVTQCLCNHLTFFGSSFFVMPNVVDVSRTAELFATFVNNPVVVCFVGAIFLVYLLVVVWARRKDIQDSAKVKITVLEDNDPLAQYRYMLTVSTGHRRGASTSAQVTVTLLGSEGESEPHHLTDPDKPVFERGGVDMFLLTTPFSLGELQSIRLWHDNSGGYPAWYINKVMVQDLETGQKWYFLCNSWLAVDMGEFVLDKVFPVATEMDLKRFSNLFFMKTVKDFRDGHIWFSVISRPPSSNFTRVQRVSCCFSLLLCTMLTSIMFWGIPKDPSEQTMDLGQIEFTWQQVMIGIQSSVIMFPVNLLIVSIFRNTRPREKKPDQPTKHPKTESAKQGKIGRVSPSQPPSPESGHREITPDAVIKDIKRIAQSLSKAMKSPIPQLEKEFGRTADINTLLSVVEEIVRQQNRAGGEFYSDSCKKEGAMALSLGAVNLQGATPHQTSAQKRNDYSQYLYRQLLHVEKELELLGPARFSDPSSHSRAVRQVQGMKGLLESHLSSSSSAGDALARSPSPSEGEARSRCCQGGLPWWFMFVGWLLVAATSGVSAYFTMMYGLTYGKDRSISWLISMVVSFFESLFITQPIKVLGFAAFFALVLKKVDQEEYGGGLLEGALASSADPDVVLGARRDSTCSFYQPPPPTDIERMRNNMIKEQKVFALIREILAYMGFMWMLLLVAYGQRDPNAFFLTRHIEQSFSNGVPDTLSLKDVFTWANTTLLSNLFGEYPGFITDGNSKLVGSARIRQVRVRKNSCRIARSMRQSVADCNAPYSWEVEDMGSYVPGWNRSADTNSSQAPTPWQYQSQARLRAHPIWGSLVLYRGGGFVADLGPDLQNGSSVLQYLFDNTWLDMYTRAVFVEFTVYNANVNLFCIVTLMLETTAVGAFQYRTELQNVRLYQSTGGLHIFVMASEVIYFLFILYYMFVQGKLMRQQKWAYFSSKWNLLELAIIILSWSALSVFIKRTLLGNRDVEYYQNHQDEFASFYDTAAADAVLGYLIAFLVLLATVKLWHLLRLNPKLHMITSTLQRAWTDISGFITVMTIMFLAYSIASNLMFGWKLYSYRTLLDAAQTMVSLQLGIFNYEEILDYNPVLGAFLIGSCIVFMTFVVVNLFISVILVAFSQEQLHHKPSEEEEIVDLMLMKLCSLFGIKCKKDEKDGVDGRKENSPEAPTTKRAHTD
ncbi:polycystic kidney disease protein 1-like 2 [Megalops cyprinoides]|uniref:polycystic kidney disease protein 1-like 2 n=1 Tax=Megalops cyprinoides TaxID=118141 RepID=UPI001865412F|nr:polycystic kidney disease protein 1-like 2 [Megalops cyprinoides]